MGFSVIGKSVPENSLKKFGGPYGIDYYFPGPLEGSGRDLKIFLGLKASEKKRGGPGGPFNLGGPVWEFGLAQFWVWGKFGGFLTT